MKFAARFCLALVVGCCFVSKAAAQIDSLMTADSIFHVGGMTAYRQKLYKEAEKQFRLAARYDPLRWDISYYRGQCCRALGRNDSALVCFNRVRPDRLSAPAEVWAMAEVYFFSAKYSAALSWYERYAALNETNVERQKLLPFRLKNCRFAAEAIQKPIQFAPKNLGATVNSAGKDYNPFLTADDQTLYFNSDRAGSTGGYREALPNHYASDFYASKQTATGWSKAVNLREPLNTPDDEKEFCLSPDGHTVMFGRRIAERPAGPCEIWSARLKNGQWLAPDPMRVLNSGVCDAWPSLSADGQTLYFISNRPGGFGGYDIWISRLKNGQWQPPQNAGASLNTPANEFDVFIHPDDQTVYFTSNGWPGFGGYDIYKSTRVGESWTPPQNLGYPLNTPFDEFDLFISASGERGYMNSNRWGGYGDLDIYVFELDPAIQPKPTAYLKGKITDCGNQKPLAATIAIIDLTTKDTVRFAQTDPADGSYLVALPADAQYAVYIESAGYLFSSQTFSFTDLAGRHLEQDYCLTRPTPGQTIRLNNIFFDFDSDRLKPESLIEMQKIQAFMRQNPELTLEVQGHTDYVGADAYNLDLSLRRARAVAAALKPSSPDRLRLSGHGSSRPVADNSLEAGRKLNRRIELVIVQIN